MIAATVGYGALRYLGPRHINDGIRVVEHAQSLQPGMASAPTPLRCPFNGQQSLPWHVLRRLSACTVHLVMLK